MTKQPADNDVMGGYRLTPMLRQYMAAKKDHPDAILMFRMGDFFELFFDDAKVAAQELDLTLTSRDKGVKPIPMAGVPHHAIEGYIAKLVSRGYTVALCDQIEDAKLAQGLVRRAVTRVITPGTVSDINAMEPSQATYLAAVVPSEHDDTRIAVAFLDLLAGELLCTIGDEGCALDELRRLGAKEVLAHATLYPVLIQALRPEGICVRTLEDLTDGQSEKIAPPAAPNPHDSHAMGQAVAAVLAYAEKTQRRPLRHVAKPQPYSRDHYLIMDEATRRGLELTVSNREGRPQGSLMAHLNRTRTACGARLLRHWLLLPLRSLSRIAERADSVEALTRYRTGRESLQLALSPIRDMERLAGRVALGRANPKDLKALGQSLLAVPEVGQAVVAVRAHESQLANMAAQWRCASLLPNVAHTLAHHLVDDPPVSRDEGGIFARGYNEALDALIELATDSQAYITRFEAAQRERTGINNLKVRYNRVFGYYIEVSRANQVQVPSDYVRRQTLANAERYVTDELKGFETQVLEAEGRRRTMEATLFADLLVSVTEVLPQVRALVRLIAQTDALAALAEVADKHRYVRPSMVEQPLSSLRGARHPVIEVMLPGGEPFVPNDIELDGTHRAVMLVTGPNMAGKSTLMRQVALCTVMAQMGGFVPADSATLGICDRLYTRVGASDNLARGQSTFMVEMMETAAILAGATPQSLVLLDEIGRGTSTFDGLSIAWAVAEHLHDVNRCRTLFATHYHELTELTQSHPRAVAVQVTAQEVAGEVVFLRQLRDGAADRSYGIEVAKLACMPAQVLQRARAVLATLEAASAERTPKVAGQQTAPGPLSEPPSRHQLGLFARSPASPHAEHEQVSPTAHHDVLAHIARTQVDHLTPMQALRLLAQWQKRLGAGPQTVATPVPRGRSAQRIR